MAGASQPIEILASGPLCGVLAAPPSKSVTNRLLVIAALASGTSEIIGPLQSDDTEAMSRGLEALGAGITPLAGGWSVAGTAGRPRPPEAGRVIDAGLSGTTLRFLASVSMLARGTVVIDGAPPLRRRPIGALVSSLRSLGASVTSTSGRAPISVRAPGLVGGEVSVDAGESSQFATALLLVAPCAERDLTLRVSNLSAGGYVALTLEAMRRFGAFVSDLGGGRYEVSAAGRYRGRREPVEYDASSAAHLFSLAMATGGDVTVTNAAPSLQPDASVVDHFAAMGARVDTPAAGGLRVRAPSVLAPIQADLSGMPDQLPTLAVLAALAPGRSRISGLAVSRGHETDRVAAVARELSKLGVGTETGPDWIEITGGKRLGPGIVETYEDHRMAMAFSALGAGAPGIVILDPSCITKTYPGFLDDAGSLGLGVRLAR